MIRAAALLLSLVSASAAAQETPRGYIRTRVPGTDLCLHWAAREYKYNYHSAGSERTPGTAEFLAMDAAFDSWRTVAQGCSDFMFVKGPMVGVATIGYEPGRDDNTNVLVFRERACREVVPFEDQCFAEGTCPNLYQCWDHGDAVIALTTTTFSKTTGVVYDADIEFNAAPHEGGEPYLFTTISSPPCEADLTPLCVATDIQNTLTHEIGHVVGLDHVDVTGTTMEPSAPTGETQKRILDHGTQQGFCRTYPPGAESPPCDDLGALSKRIVAVNRGTPGLSHVGCSAGLSASPLGLAGALALALVGVSRRRRR